MPTTHGWDLLWLVRAEELGGPLDLWTEGINPRDRWHHVQFSEAQISLTDAKRNGFPEEVNTMGEEEESQSIGS
jgi:hypothetical protein